MSYNLLKEPWLPTSKGKVGILEIFDSQKRMLLGSPWEKTAIFKLLLAIGQAAWTPATEAELEKISLKDFREEILIYLEKWKNEFHLHGEKPFLQVPKIFNAKVASFDDLRPEVASGNTTILFDGSRGDISVSEQALLVVTLQNFSMGTKKIDFAFPIVHGGHTKKTARSGISGISTRHAFFFSLTLLESVKNNLLTKEQIKHWPSGLGNPPWEWEEDFSEDFLQTFQDTYMRRLLGMSRFLLLAKEGMHITDGVAHNDKEAELIEPSVFKGCFLRAISKIDSSLLYPLQLYPLQRIKDKKFRLWNGGAKVSLKCGQAFFSGDDDFFEKEYYTTAKELLELDLSLAEQQAKSLYLSVKNYFTSFGTQENTAVKKAKKATDIFWKNIIPPSGKLSSITTDKEALHACYYTACPSGTGRQLAAAEKYKPN